MIEYKFEYKFVFLMIVRRNRKMMRIFVTEGFEKKKRRGFGAKGREEQKMGGKVAGD